MSFDLGLSGWQRRKANMAVVDAIKAEAEEKTPSIQSEILFQPQMQKMQKFQVFPSDGKTSK